MGKEKMIPKSIPRTTSLLTWGLIASSIISCYSRADYNIILGFLILFVRGHNSGEKKRLLNRFQIQILLISLIFDIIWIIEYYSYWTHGDETSELWQSLSFIHNCAFCLAIIEFCIKIFVTLFIYQDFTKSEGTISELIDFNYKQ